MKEKNKFIVCSLLCEAKKEGACRDHAVVEDR
jgi:hypothetical protein